EYKAFDIRDVSNGVELFSHGGMNYFSRWELFQVSGLFTPFSQDVARKMGEYVRFSLIVAQPSLAEGVQSAYQVPGRSVPSKLSQEGDVIMKSGLAALCAAAVCTAIAFSAAPAGAQSRLKTCNDEWNAMKANNTVGDKRYADFRKECLARTAAKPS